jgi:hypothetical protein
MSLVLQVSDLDLTSHPLYVVWHFLEFHPDFYDWVLLSSGFAYTGTLTFSCASPL